MYIPVKSDFLKDKLYGSDRTDKDTLEIYAIIDFLIGFPLVISLSLVNVSGAYIIFKGVGILFGLFLIYGCGAIIQQINTERRVDKMFEEGRTKVMYDFRSFRSFDKGEGNGSNE